jgi:hypothetical protein
MKFPDFFARIPAITLRDPLAELLGAAEGGLIAYSYVDAVKLAGHSCPTVAGAWLMTVRALRALYGDEMPVRGDALGGCQRGVGHGQQGINGSLVGGGELLGGSKHRGIS